MLLQATNPFGMVQQVTYIIIILQIGLTTVFYYVAKIINDKTLLKWAKEAIVDAVITTFFAILILNGILPFLNDLSVALAGEYLKSIGILNTQNYDMIDLVLELMKTGPFRCLIQIRNFLYFMYAHLFSVAPAKMSFKYLEGTGSGIGIYDFAFQNLFANILYYEIIYFLLYKILVLFKYFLFPLLFPVGIALRGFKASKGVGAFFIALSLSFYIVFPFVYLFSMLLYPIHTECAPYIEEYSLANKCDMLNPASGEYNALSAASLAAKLNWEFFLTTIRNGFDEFFREIIVAFCLYPLLAFAFAATTTNVGTTFFGGRVPEIGRGLIKFI